jgi:MFS transporter, OFA family, oxalate/formate antiporter
MSNQTQAAVGAVSTTKSNFGSRGWLIILISLLSILLQSTIINDSLNITIPAFAEHFGWNINVLYMFSTISAWIAVAGAAFWGFVSHKKSAKLVWVGSLALIAASCFAWAHVGTTGAYFAVIAVASVAGQGFAYIGNFNIISNWFPRKKGLAMGWVTIGFPLSASITVPLVNGLLKSGGLARVYTFYGIAAAMLCVLAFLILKDYPEEAGCCADNDASLSKEEAQAKLREGLEYMKSSPWTVGRLLKTPQVWNITFFFGVLQLLSLGIMTNFIPRGLQAGYPMNELTIMLPIAGLIACFGSYFCGWLDGKFGTKKATMWTLAVAVVSITLNLIPTRITMYASLPFLGFMLGGAANYIVSITNTIWGRYDFPLAYKVILPLTSIVGACGVAIVGILGNTFNYATAYAVLGVLALISIYGVSRLNDTLVGKN